jgi:hypothetical protein
MGCIPSKCPSVLYDTKEYDIKIQKVVTRVPSIDVVQYLTSKNPFLKPGINITGRIILADEIWKLAMCDKNRVKNVCELMKTVDIWNELNKDNFGKKMSDINFSLNKVFIVNPFLFEGLPRTGRMTIAAGVWEVVMSSDTPFESTMSILKEVCIWNEMNRGLEPNV